jgi:hypothetical protein
MKIGTFISRLYGDAQSSLGYGQQRAKCFRLKAIIGECSGLPRNAPAANKKWMNMKEMFYYITQ